MFYFDRLPTFTNICTINYSIHLKEVTKSSMNTSNLLNYKGLFTCYIIKFWKVEGSDQYTNSQ